VVRASFLFIYTFTWQCGAEERREGESSASLAQEKKKLGEERGGERQHAGAGRKGAPFSFCNC
jgi:hypothetical protein